MVKNVPAVWETQVRSLGWKDPLEKEMVYYNAYTQMQFRDSIENFTEKLEQLPDLSEDELREISDAVKKFRMK